MRACVYCGTSLDGRHWMRTLCYECYYSDARGAIAANKAIARARMGYGVIEFAPKRVLFRLPESKQCIVVLP